jgi:hypothetical protein
VHGGAGSRAPFRRDVLDAEVGLGGLIDCPTLDDLREVYFELAWQQHGGSGLNVTLGELDDMRAEELLWYLERVRKQRQKEADAMKKGAPRAHAPRRRR